MVVLSRSRIMILALVLVLGCAGGALTAQTLVHVGQNDGGVDRWYAEMVTRFKEETGITVELSLVNSGVIQEKLVTMLMAGIALDTMEGSFFHLAAFNIDELLEDLYPWMKRSGVRESDYPVPTIEYAKTPKGALVGLPYQLWTFGAAYNQTMLETYGMATPTSDWTWADLEEIATRATRMRPDGRVETYGWNLPLTWARLHALIRSGGGDYLDQRNNPTRSTLLSEGVMNALSLVDRVAQRGGVEAGWGSFRADGKAALTYNAGPNLLQLVEGRFELGWIPYPKGPTKNRGGELTPYYVMMLKDTPHKDAAWRWLQFLAHNDTNQRLFSQMTERIPGLTRSTQAFFKELQGRNYSAVNLFTQIMDPTSFPRYAEWDPYLGVVDQWLRRALINRDVSLREALMQADQLINAQLADEASRN